MYDVPESHVVYFIGVVNIYAVGSKRQEAGSKKCMPLPFVFSLFTAAFYKN